MLIRSKLLLAGLTAALVLSVAVTSASANRLSVDNKTFRVTWAPLSLVAEALSEPINCSVTFEGSFHSNTIVKSEGLLIGHVYRASLGPCNGGGSATINQEALPWHIRYRGFTGTLPNITGVVLGLVGAKFTVHDNGTGLTCVTTTTATNPGIGITNVNTTTHLIETIRANENAPIPLRGNFFCEIGGNGVFVGNGTVRLQNSTTRIRLTLI